MEVEKNSNRNILISVGLIILIIIAAIVGYFIIKNNSKIKVSFVEENVCNDVIYDGTLKKLTNLETNEKYTVTNNEATEAGEYTVSVKLNKGYVWDDNTETDKTFDCKIAQKKSELSVNKELLELKKGNEGSLVISSKVKGTIAITIDEKIAKVNEGLQISKYTDNLTIKIKGVSEGTTVLQIIFTPEDKNYEVETTDVKITINNASESSSKKVNIPNNSICNNVTQNENVQKLVSETDYNGYTLTGQLEGKEAGEYKINAVLKKGYIWSDNTSGNKIITCRINKYKLTETKHTCVGGEKFVIDISDITLNNKDAVKNITNNNNITSIKTQGSCPPICYATTDGKGMCIAANCIQLGKYEVSCLKPGTDKITFKMENGEELNYNVTIKSGDYISLAHSNTEIEGILCEAGKTVDIVVNTFKDGGASGVLKSYTTADKSVATVGMNKTNQPTCVGCTALVVKCIKKGNTTLIIKTTNGAKRSFPITYNATNIK